MSLALLLISMVNKTVWVRRRGNETTTICLWFEPQVANFHKNIRNSWSGTLPGRLGWHRSFVCGSRRGVGNGVYTLLTHIVSRARILIFEMFRGKSIHILRKSDTNLKTKCNNLCWVLGVARCERRLMSPPFLWCTYPRQPPLSSWSWGVWRQTWPSLWHYSGYGNVYTELTYNEPVDRINAMSIILNRSYTS